MDSSVWQARAIVAHEVIAKAVREYVENGWGDFADLGEDDWNVIVELTELLASPSPPTAFQEAYNLLAARAVDS